MEAFARVLWIVLGALIAALVGYLTSYFNERGKNLATKDDFDDLKTQTADLTKITEEIKDKISFDTWDRQKRWELKQGVLFEATRRISEVDDSVMSLSSTLKLGPQFDHNATWEESKAKKLKRWDKAISALDETRFFVTVVCGKEMINAIDNYAGLATQIVAAFKDDVEAYSKQNRELTKRMLISRLAIRKELGFESLPMYQSFESSASSSQSA
ncbi:MAG TPA: hypothetical protein VGI45_24880 [Terracidiphilus sp.]|jgi:hypothetical protein